MFFSGHLLFEVLVSFDLLTKNLRFSFHVGDYPIVISFCQLLFSLDMHQTAGLLVNYLLGNFPYVVVFVDG